MGKKTTQKRSLTENLRRNLITTGLILLVAYAGIHILTRTNGFRGLVADKISNGTRLPVVLEHCGMSPLLNLRLKNLDFPGVRMPEVNVVFDWFAWLSK